jgi:hypothetical protein
MSSSEARLIAVRVRNHARAPPARSAIGSEWKGMLVAI